MKKVLHLVTVLSLLLALLPAVVVLAQTEEPTATPPPADTTAPTDQPVAAEAPTEAAPTEAAPTEAAPTEAVPTEAAPTEAVPTEAAPTEAVPTEAAPTEAAPTEAVPTEAAPTEAAPTEQPTVTVEQPAEVVEPTVEPAVEPAAPEQPPLAPEQPPVVPVEPEVPTAEPPVAANSVDASASTNKPLSTNITLVNLGLVLANVHADYRLVSGGTWPSVPAPDVDFSITQDGGQKIIRQYSPYWPPGTSGSGSAIMSSSEALGSVVQILARNQTPSSGAYSGFITDSDTFYVPLAIRQLVGASGLANSQIIVQNTGASAINVSVQFINASGAPGLTQNLNNIPAGSSNYYDLDTETGLTAGFYGSAVVHATTPGGRIVVVSNLFTGANGLQTFNAFPKESVGTKWLAPLVTSRLANGLSTPVTVQNLSGADMAPGTISLDCVRDATSPGAPTLHIVNPSPVVNNGSAFFNPVIDPTNFPDLWYGSCTINAPGSVVGFVQMRTIGTDLAAAYEAINASSSDKVAFAPLVGKMLANGFATVLTIQNLSTTSDAHVTVDYVPSAEYIASGGSATTITIPSFTIPAGGSVLHNHRLASGANSVPGLPAGWYGSAKVTSADQPVSGFMQLTNINPSGDTTMAHDLFTRAS